MVKKIVLLVLLLLIAVLVAWYGQQRIFRFQTSEPTPATQGKVLVKTNETTPSPVKNMYENTTYAFGFEMSDGFQANETTFEESQPGGVIHLVQIGNTEVAMTETYQEKGIVIYVAEINPALANGSDPLAAPNGMEPFSQEDTILAGEKAKKYKDGEVYTVAKNGYEYLLVLGTETDQLTKDTFSKIVSTFTFTK
jgi:hypothetical protein